MGLTDKEIENLLLQLQEDKDENLEDLADQISSDGSDSNDEVSHSNKYEGISHGGSTSLTPRLHTPKFV